MSDMYLHAERQRILFLLERDGLDATVEFVARTHRLYRLSLKSGMAREKTYRRGYLESCIDFRQFLKANNAYRPVLAEIKRSS